MIKMLRRYVVKGHSMEPSFRDGDKVLVSSLFFTLRKDDVVVFSDGKRDCLKRIVATRGNNYVAAGDNKNHSRTYNVARSRIKGKFLMKY